MKVAVKICGLSAPEGIAAAAAGGARFVGFVFYPPSPRFVAPEAAARLARMVPEGIEKVGVFVDPSDAEIEAAASSIDMIQLHGEESPRRTAEIRARFRLPVMKAIKVADRADIERAEAHLDVADWFMFDAKAPPSKGDALPGGNAAAFDWRLLGGARGPVKGRPWMLSGGLTSKNVAEAIRISGAEAVDVSSGVEERPGVKSPERIRAFLEAVGACV